MCLARMCRVFMEVLAFCGAVPRTTWRRVSIFTILTSLGSFVSTYLLSNLWWPNFALQSALGFAVATPIGSSLLFKDWLFRGTAVVQYTYSLTRLKEWPCLRMDIFFFIKAFVEAEQRSYDKQISTMFLLWSSLVFKHWFFRGTPVVEYDKLKSVLCVRRTGAFFLLRLLSMQLKL